MSQQFVVIYDRLTGEASVEAFSGPDAVDLAMQRRFQAELTASSHQEVASLSAESEDDLRATHSRYFSTSEEMLDALIAS
jgi:hypothetical protein